LLNNDLKRYSPRWFYLGDYRIVQTFPISPTQWSNLPERLKAWKTREVNVRGAAKQWCAKNKIDITDFREALDQGRWNFDAMVIECISFDRKFYEMLTKEENSGTVAE
jgi:hypothetical protein